MTTDTARLGAGDIAAYREMLDIFAQSFDDFARYSAAQPSDDYIAGLLGRPECIALVARSAGGVIAGLTAYALPRFEQAGTEVYLYDLAVDEAHRGRGVATALIGRLRGVARDIGASVVFVQAHADDAAAIAVYDRIGRRADVVQFDIAPRAWP